SESPYRRSSTSSPTRSLNEAPRVHHAAGWCGCRLAAGSERAAAGDGVEISAAPVSFPVQLFGYRWICKVAWIDCGREHLAIMASMSASALLTRNPHPATPPPPLRVACQ